MNYQLLNARIKDKAIIYQIKKESIKKYVEEIWGWNEQFQQNAFENDFVLQNYKIITLNDNIVGFLETNETDDKINITEIHLSPSCQGHGIGSKIIKNIMFQAEKNNKSVELGCFIKNAGAKRLYLKLGFKIIQETKTHFIFKYSWYE